MSSLRPCRMPHTLAPVCELQSLCQSVSAWLPCGEPAGERRHVAVAHRAPHGVEAQAVDLQEQHARRPVVRASASVLRAGRRGGRRSRPRRGRAGSTRARRPRTSPPPRPPRCPGPRSPRPGSTNETASSAAPSSRNEPMPSVKHRDRAARPAGSAATPRAESTPNASAITVGCHHCGIAKPGSQRVEQRAARAPTRSQTSSTRATTRPPRTIRPLTARSRCLRRRRADQCATRPATTQHEHGGEQVATTGSSKIPPLTTPSTA